MLGATPVICGIVMLLAAQVAVPAHIPKQRSPSDAEILTVLSSRLNGLANRKWDVAWQYRIPVWNEVALWELSLCVLRSVEPEQLVNGISLEGVRSTYTLERLVRGAWHSALTIEIADLVTAKYTALADNSEVAPIWNLALQFPCLDRRAIRIAEGWLDSDSPHLRRLGAQWLKMTASRQEWPWRRQEPWYICIGIGSRDPRKGIRNTLRHNPVWPLAFLDERTTKVTPSTVPRPLAELPRDIRAERVRMLLTVVRDPDWDLYLRYRTLDLLTRAEGWYDLATLRDLAMSKREGLASEVMALGAVCALSRCPTKRALELLVEVVAQGHESARFQAASHLRFVAGLEVPPLVTWFNVAGQRRAEPWRQPGAWSDVARWIVDDALRAHVVRDLRAQVKRLPENWPGAKQPELTPLLLHDHPGLWYVHRHRIPEIVLERSKEEDVFWVPYKGGTERTP